MVRLTPTEHLGGLKFEMWCAACGAIYTGDEVPWDDVCSCQKGSVLSARSSV